MGVAPSKQARLREYVERETQVVVDAVAIGDYTHQTLFLLELLPKLFEAYDTNEDAWLQLSELHAFLSDYLRVLLDYGPQLMKKHLFANVAKILSHIKKSHPQKYDLISKEWEVDRAKMLTDFTDIINGHIRALEKDPMWLRLEAKKNNHMALYDQEYERQFSTNNIIDVKAGLTSIEMKHQHRVYKNQQRKAAAAQRPSGFASPRNGMASIIGNNRRGSIGNGLTSFVAPRPTGLLSPRANQAPRGVFSFGQNTPAPKRGSLGPASPRPPGGHASTPFAGAVAGKRASLPDVRNPGLALGTFARRTSTAGPAASPMSPGLQRLLQQYTKPAGAGGALMSQLDPQAPPPNPYSDMVAPKDGLLYRWLVLLKAGEPSFVVDYGQVDAAHCVSRPAFLQTFRMVLENTCLSFTRITRQLFNRSRCGPVISAYQRQVLEGKPGRRRRPVNRGKNRRNSGNPDRQSKPNQSFGSFHPQSGPSHDVFVMNNLDEEGEEDEDIEELILAPAPMRGNSLATPGIDRPTFDISVSLPAPTVESNYSETPPFESKISTGLPVSNLAGFQEEDDEDEYNDDDDDDEQEEEDDEPVFAMNDTLPTPNPANVAGQMIYEDDDYEEDEDYEESD
jgi:hypothetical protein